MSNMVGLNTALTGIRAAQVGLDTTSHNIANANNPGYTRQRVMLQARLPHTTPAGPVGAGTDVTLGRMRDAFLDSRARSASMAGAFADTRAKLLTRVEMALAEPDNGISTQLGALWNSFETLAGSPADLASRRQVLASLSGVVSRVSGISDQWSSLTADTRTTLATTVDTANTLLDQVATINRKVATAGGASTAAPDLLDKRDALLDQLAELTGATSTIGADGVATVSLSGVTLADRNVVSRLNLAPDDRVLADDGTVLSPSGRAGGLQNFLLVDMPGQRAALDEFVTRLADALNTQHAAGLRPDGTAGGPMLTYDPADPSRSLALAIAAPEDIAAAGPAAEQVPAQPPGRYDGGNANALAGLRNNPPSGDTIVLDDRLRSVTVDLAAQVAGSRREAESQDALGAAATAARMSAHGVSFDEEMVDLVRYQRSLEAASRIMTALDDALNRIVNNTGLVGR